MRATRLLLLFGLLQLPTLPQLPATIQGRVIDAITAQPLPRATVLMRSTRGDTLLTRDAGPDGSFAFQNVPPGNYTIEASFSGYITNQYGQRRVVSSDPRLDTVPVVNTLDPGQSLSGIEIPLTPGGVIFGRLVDDRGELVVGATVQALQTRYRNGQRERVAVLSVTSNDLGEYRLFTLLPGEYRVAAKESPLAQASVPWYFPGTPDPKESQAIDLRVGQTIGGIDVSGIPTRGRRLSGTLQGLDGIGASVSLSSRNGDVQMKKSVDADTGTFSFSGVPPGPYMLTATSIDQKASMPIDVRNADVSNVRLTLGEGFAIPTRVRIEGHGDSDDPVLETIYFTVRPEPPIPGLDVVQYSPFPDGHLTLTLLAGDYRLDITRPEDMYVKSMRLGDVEVLDQGLRVTNSSDTRLEVAIGTNPGSIQGRTAGNGATVVLVPDAARRGQRPLYKAAPVGASGEFAFQKVPPGDYKLFVWREENGGPWLDPEYLRVYEDRGVPVHVEPGKRTVVDGVLPVL